MAETYTVKITDQAKGQMREIVHYITNTLKDPDAALNLLDTLEKAIKSLNQFPQRVALTDEGRMQCKLQNRAKIVFNCTIFAPSLIFNLYSI